MSLKSNRLLTIDINLFSMYTIKIKSRYLISKSRKSTINDRKRRYRKKKTKTIVIIPKVSQSLHIDNVTIIQDLSLT